MNSLGEALGTLARVGGRVLRGPSAFVLAVAAVVVAVLTVLVIVLVTSPGGPGTLGTVLLVALPFALAVPIVTLASRRRRWIASIAETASHRVITPTASGSEMVGPADLTDRVEREMRGRPGEEDVRAVFDAVTESRVPGSPRGAGARLTRILGVGRLSVVGHALGRVDQAQRALMTAVGGPVNAPYLRDDLRVTLAAALGMFVAIPIGGLAAIIIALVLLAR